LSGSQFPDEIGIGGLLFILVSIHCFLTLNLSNNIFFNFRHFSPGPDLAKTNLSKINQDW